MKLEEETPPTPFRQDTWDGLRLISTNQLRTTQFNRNGFLFSQVAPYTNWQDFQNEALRLWSIYAEIARPSELQRLSVRFINGIPIKNDAPLESILHSPPRFPEGLTLSLGNYLHQEQFAYLGPKTTYAINRIQTLLQLPSNAPNEITLILDLDVSTCQPQELIPGQPCLDLFQERLQDIRQLKNEMFFGSVTTNALELFKGEQR